jgi:hypothetical protein
MSQNGQRPSRTTPKGIRRSDAFARIEDPAERVRLAFKLFDSEGVALVNLLSDGSGALDQMRERPRNLGIVLDEHLVRDAERARIELDTLAKVVSANLTRAALEAAPERPASSLTRGRTIALPSGLSSLSPVACIASSCAPRAMTTISLPLAARRAAK